MSVQKKLVLSDEHLDVINNAVAEFSGDMTVLESAIGALVMGQLMGWKVLRLVHGSSAYSKYEKILGIKFKNSCPERGVYSGKSLALEIADKAESYWDIVRGTKPGRSSELKNLTI